MASAFSLGIFQDPFAPAGIGEQQRAASTFARRIYVQWPPTVGGHRGLQRGRHCLVERLEINEKARAQNADLSGG